MPASLYNSLLLPDLKQMVDSLVDWAQKEPEWLTAVAAA